MAGSSDALLAMFDIVGYSRLSRDGQRAAADALWAALGSVVETMSATPKWRVDGDAAVLYITPFALSAADTRRGVIEFLNIARDACIRYSVPGEYEGGDRQLRVAITYGSLDFHKVTLGSVPSPNSPSWIPLGDVVGSAARLISFCEPGEILLSERVVDDLLFELSLTDRMSAITARWGVPNQKPLLSAAPLSWKLWANPPVRVKHGAVLETYSYVPRDGTHDARLYSPRSALQSYKQYSYFPPLDKSTVEQLEEHALTEELRSAVDSAYAAMSQINDTLTFASWSSVLRLLRNIAYDPNDDILVVWRTDSIRESSVTAWWSQPEAEEYLRYLTQNSRVSRFNQRQLVIHDGNAPPEPPPALRELHLRNDGTLRALHSVLLHREGYLGRLRFGVTLSRTKEWALISIPPTALAERRYEPARTAKLIGAMGDS